MVDSSNRRTVLRLVGGAVGAAVASTAVRRPERSPAAAWSDVDDVALRVDADGWTGLDPDPIAGEATPTLVLSEGRPYDLTVTNADESVHRLELRDASGGVVAGSDAIEAGESRTLSLRPTPELAAYGCGVHDGTSAGSIDVRLENDTGVDPAGD